MTRERELCARELLEVAPSVTRFIRAQMRRHRALGLSVPQFRTLAFIERAGGASLGSVAEHLGLTAPSACKIVDGLQGRELITRLPSPVDRRRVSLGITPAGKKVVADARRATLRSMEGLLAGMDEKGLETTIESMKALRAVFAGEAADGNS